MLYQILKYKFIFFILLFFSIPLLGQDLYSDSIVIKMELLFSQPNFWQLLEQNKEPKIDIPATLIVNDTETFDNVGVRFKGNSSYSMSNEKKPFNISMDAFVDGQNLWDYQTLNLGNAFMDPTYVREIISYDIFRKYMPAGRAGYVRLYINGEYWGLYINVEQVNKDFLQNWFFSDEGNLYKGDPSGRLNWIPNDVPAMQRDYEKKTNETENDWSDLIHLIDVLNNSSDLETDLPQVLNADRAIWYIALCNILVNLDSYIYEGHNYFIYNNPASQRFNLIPWDLNESFGCFPAHRLSVKELEEYAVFYNINQQDMPLVSRMLQVPQYHDIYLAHYRTLLNHELHPDTLLPKIQHLQALIDDYVRSDIRKLYPYDFFLENVTNPVVIQDNRTAPGIMTLVENRRKYLLNDPDLQRSSPMITSVSCMPETLCVGTNAIFTAEISDNFDIEWAALFCKIGVETFFETPMHDDGQHDDNAPGDGLFGCYLTIPKGSAGNSLDYYIIARNQQGGIKFFPERAEFEYLSQQITSGTQLSDLVINEFMGGNASTIQDPQGEYDDWIEIYNRSSATVSIKGMHLTDDLIDPKKWVFPDTSIAGYGYLLIWADDDTDDSPGLHANFRLDKSGESIGLYDTEENGNELIDSYSFGQQEDDVSTGRFPNGDGNFLQMISPTPESENVTTSGIEKNSSVLPAKPNLYPNYPNPFNPQTVIPYCLHSSGIVQIKIYNALGQEVKTLIEAFMPVGRHQALWNGTDEYGQPMGSGVYICIMQIDKSIVKKKMILMR